MICVIVGEIAVEDVDHRLGAQPLGELGEAPEIGHEDGDLAQLAPEPHRVRVAEHALRQLGAHVAAQRLAHELAVAERPHHLAHRAREHADLVVAARAHHRVQVALPDAQREIGEILERSGHPSGGRDAAAERDQDGEGAQQEGAPALRVDPLRVVARGHHDCRAPAEAPRRQRHRAGQVAFAAVPEFDARPRVALEGHLRQRGGGNAGHPMRAAPPRLDERAAVAGGQEDPPAGRHLDLVEKLGEPGQREVDREHARD
jgi:hypothetical protein